MWHSLPNKLFELSYWALAKERAKLTADAAKLQQEKAKIANIKQAATEYKGQLDNAVEQAAEANKIEAKQNKAHLANAAQDLKWLQAI